MRVPLAREGYPFIAAAALPAAALLAAALTWGGTSLWALAGAAMALALAMLGFFRDPERRGPRGSGLILAPADGRVIDVSTIDEPTYLKGEALRVSIFLSLLDVHVNRYPVSGEVDHRSDEHGRFEPAWRSSASHSNERAGTGIRGGGRSVLVNQVAGLAAKRIVTYAELGDAVAQGERMGLIRFGSRLDVYMPTDVKIDVETGQRAVGGVTVIARLPGVAEESP
jgi:phosphatidylserine decarboxylase